MSRLRIKNISQRISTGEAVVIIQYAYGKWQEYCEQIPEDALQKMAKSGLYSFTATFLFTKRTTLEPCNLARPLFAGGVAFLASLIYTLTNPIFNMIFGDDSLLAHREIIKQVVNITLTSAAVAYFGASKVNVYALPLLGSLSMNLIKSLIDLIPTAAEYIWKDKQVAAELREWFKEWHIDAPAGSGSVFVNFGIFPSVGLS